MFYKREENEILNGGDTVSTPSGILTAGTKDEFTYPQDGWYWFDTFDEALAYFASSSTGNTITPRQARLILLQYNLLDDIELLIKDNRAIQIWWEYSIDIQRNNEQLLEFATLAELSDEQLDTMFIEASKL